MHNFKSFTGKISLKKFSYVNLARYLPDNY